MLSVVLLRDITTHTVQQNVVRRTVKMDEGDEEMATLFDDPDRDSDSSMGLGCASIIGLIFWGLVLVLMWKLLS